MSIGHFRIMEAGTRGCFSWPYRAEKDLTKSLKGRKTPRKRLRFFEMPYFNMYRWHIADPIYFKEDLKVTIQALGWRSECRFLPLQDDISSVVYWYSDTLEDEYPAFSSKNDLEIM